MSDTARWDRVKSLFLRANEMDAESREQLLESLAVEDSLLAQEVRTLLAAGREAPDVLEGTAEEALESFANHSPDLLERGMKVDAYVLDNRVGTGGMGTVWRCHRQDEPDQPLAIKFIRRGLDTAIMLRRFAAERDSLATLEHPGIAALRDAGVASGDRPYLVMEFVEGEPLDRYCDRRALPVRDRLALFRSVCEAVEFAHRNLVVHRDIKPENVLVTTDGTPKLLDFGVARILTVSSERAEAATARQERLLTPRYAAPEVLAGEPVSTAADVYSLGVVLFELLCGQPPHELRGATRDEAMETVRRQQVVRPSQRVEPGAAALRSLRPEALRRSLRGDLDNIALTAVRAEPARRYGSVSALSDDIERYLKGLPVRARVDSVGYRLGKLVRRNPVVFLASAVMLVALVAAAAATLHEARLADAETRFARSEAESLHRVVDLLIGIFEGSGLEGEGAGSGALSAAELVDRSWFLLEEGVGEDELVRSTLQHALGRVYTELGAYEKADHLLASALAIRESSYAAPHPEIAEVLASLGALRRAQGRARDAEALLRRSLEQWQATWGLDHADAAVAAAEIGRVLVDTGAYDEATHWLGIAAATRERELGPSHSQTLAVRGQLAAVAYRQEHFEVAARLLEDIVRSLEARDSGQDLSIAAYLARLGMVRRGQGRLDAAEDALRRALAIQFRLLPPGHASVAATRVSLGVVYYEARDYLAAAEQFGRAADAMEALAGPRDATTVQARLDQARALRANGEEEAAAALLDRLAREVAPSLPTSSRLRLALLAVHAQSLIARGRSEDAISALREVAAILRTDPDRDEGLLREVEQTLAEAQAGG